MADDIEAVLDRLVRDVEAAVHALYRGDMRQATAKARTGGLARAAAEAIRGGASPAAPGAPTARPSAAFVAPVGATGGTLGWSREEGEAVMKCVLAWLPMGAPSSATPDSKCIGAGREMVPTWGERERARAALKRVTG